MAAPLQTARACEEVIEFIAALLLLSILSPRPVFAQQTDRAIEMRIVHKPDCVSVGFADFDLLQGRFENLRGTFNLRDGQGNEVTSCAVDFHAPTARSHVLILKRPGVEYASLTVELTDGETRLFRKELNLPPVVETAEFSPFTAEKVQVIPGASRVDEPVPAAITSLRLPDYGRIEAEKLSPAPRQIEVEATFRQVRCDLNYPIAAAQNNSFIGRQTAHPDDLARKSLYISLRSPLFDPQTGHYEMDAKYLAELPLDPDWLRPALSAEGDTSVSVPVDRIRLQAGTKKVHVSALGEIYITGQRTDGLMQAIHSVVQDDEGNLYFAQDYRGCIRLNVHKGEWEALPVDVYAFLQKHLPPVESLPYPKDQVTGCRIDFCSHVHYHNGRIYLSFPRNALFGDSLFLAAIVSIPTRDWDDPPKFEEQMRFLGGSWPTARFPLFDRWVEPEEATRKLLWMVGDGNRLYFISYHNNYFWVVDLEEDGTPKAVKRIESFAGKKIASFSFNLRWLLSGADGQPLGVTVDLTLEDGKNQTVCLPRDQQEFTAVPEGTMERFISRPGVIRGETQYGVTTFEKKWLAQYLGWGADQAGEGQVFLYYDAIAAMRRDPQRYGFILDRISRVSLAPSYHLVTLPDQPNRAIGVGEYGYYQAFFDTSRAEEGIIRKDFLKLDTADMPTDLAVAIGLGPYAHRWHREGDKLYLYYVGYTGITRLLYSVGGQPLARFTMEPLHSKMPLKNVDTGGGDFKWYRELNPGLDGKLIMTGVHEANRGGSPYSNGLLYFDTEKLDAQYQLSEMSRGHSTSELDWRVVYGKAEGPAQEIYLGADYNETYAYLLPPDRRPTTAAPKILVYEDRQPLGVRDRYGFTLAPADSQGFGHVEHAFAPDQIHLLVLISDGRDALLASLDPLAGRFADVKRIRGRLMTFDRPSTVLINTPDDRTLLGVYDHEPATSVTFTEIGVEANGRLSLQPYLTLTAKEAQSLAGSVMDFLPDRARQDGSYDLMIGGSTRWDAADTQVRLIPDFIPPRPSAVATP